MPSKESKPILCDLCGRKVDTPVQVTRSFQYGKDGKTYGSSYSKTLCENCASRVDKVLNVNIESVRRDAAGMGTVTF